MSFLNNVCKSKLCDYGQFWIFEWILFARRCCDFYVLSRPCTFVPAGDSPNECRLSWIAHDPAPNSNSCNLHLLRTRMVGCGPFGTHNAHVRHVTSIKTTCSRKILASNIPKFAGAASKSRALIKFKAHKLVHECTNPAISCTKSRGISDRVNVDRFVNHVLLTITRVTGTLTSRAR